MNRVEDSLIAQIDDSLAGINAVQRDEMCRDEQAQWRFYARALDDAHDQAEKSRGAVDEEGHRFRFARPDITDQELFDEVRALKDKLDEAERRLTSFCAPANLSRRRMRKLGDNDDEAEKRKILKTLEKNLLDLEREYTAATVSLHARLYLKDQRELQRRVLHLRGKKDLDFTMQKWNELYPSTTHSNGNGRHA
jgi:hypothetical protein